MDILKLFFTGILYINAVMAAVTPVFSAILLKRGRGNPIYFNFGMSTLFLGLWMAATLLDFFRLTPFSSDVHARLGFLLGLWILHYFLLFSIFFPFRLISDNRRISVIYIATLLSSLLAILPTFVKDAIVLFPFRFRTIDPLLLTIYNLYFVGLSVFALMNLFKNYERSDGIYRIQLRKIIAGTSIAVFANIIFSLVNFYYTDFDLTAVGMFFALGVLIYIYLILFKQENRTILK